MPSQARPYGMISQKHTGGLPFAGATIMHPIASAMGANVAQGDIVKLLADGTVAKETGTAAVTATGVIGVFMGCTYTDPTMKWKVIKQLWPTGTLAADAMAYICDDPAAIFQIQANGSVPQAALGANAGIVQNAPDLAYGISRIALDAASVAVAATLPLRIVGFVNGTDQAPGDAFTDVLVRWNAGMHAYNVALGF
jgi:hypothetical protein